jgi:hypothetical protein
MANKEHYELGLVRAGSAVIGFIVKAPGGGYRFRSNTSAHGSGRVARPTPAAAVPAWARRLVAKYAEPIAPTRGWRVVYGESRPAWEQIFQTKREADAFAQKHRSFGDVIFSVAKVIPGQPPQSLAAAIAAAHPTTGAV